MTRTRAVWIAIVLAVMLGVSMLVNFTLLGVALHFHSGGNPTREFTEVHVLGNRDATDKVLDIPLVGVISDVDAGRTPSIVRTISAELEQARTDAHVKAILLEINSPGGGVTASDILYHNLDEFRKARKVPIVALCNDLTASGGYYSAMAADHIMAHETSLVGSIGVIAEFTDVHGLLQKIGVQMNVIKSKRADGTESFKDIGSPFREMKPAERELMQTMIGQMWNRFTHVVADGRQGKLTLDAVKNLADGRIWTGNEALNLKLVDSLGYREDAWKKAAELAGVPNARLVTYQRAGSWLGDLLGVQSDAGALKTLLERTVDPAAGSPRLMYLWTMGR